LAAVRDILDIEYIYVVVISSLISRNSDAKRKKMTLDILRFGACWTTQAQCYRNGDADGTLDRHLLQAVGADHDKKIQAEIKMK
jgi:hypothetical protein